MPFNVVILAAGQGKRMRSELPKVLAPLAGKPLLGHVLATARALKPAMIGVVYGHGGEQVDSNHSRLTILTANLEDPHGYGRIVRDARGAITGIVEEKDATDEQRNIREINTGIMMLPGKQLETWLNKLSDKNSQGEYYLTDVVALAIEDGVKVDAWQASDASEVLGVNNRQQLAHLERTLQRQTARRLLEDGVTLADPARIDVRGELRCGKDVSIDVNCVFEGSVEIDDGASIGANCVLRNARVGGQTRVEPFTMIDDAVIGVNCRLGPYTRIRPGTSLAADVHIGNFVEVKASAIGPGSKANHLAYIGDTTVGRDVNVGAGTITCNYDGANKHRTQIGDNVHIGSDVQLVAPVSVGAGATVGAGTTVWKDVVDGTLVVNAKRQTVRVEWKRPVKA